VEARAISLSREVDLIRSAVQAVRLLVEQLREFPTSDLGLPRDLPGALRAALVLIDARLHALDRVVRGHLDPEVLWTKESAANGEPDAEETDVAIGWSQKDRIDHHRRELQRAERRARHGQAQRSRKQGRHAGQ